MKQSRINVYLDRYQLKEVVARVRYNQNLDYWDGRKWQNEGTDRHKGITKLRGGRYAIIKGTDWEGERDYAYIVDADKASHENLKAQRLELLETKKFAELKKLYEEKYPPQADDL